MSEINCPRCKTAFETSERLLQHFAGSPGCFQCTVLLAGMAGRSGNQPLTPSADNPQTFPLSSVVVMPRRTLMFAGSIVVAVSMALSAVVAASMAMWFNTRGVLKEPVGTPLIVQTAKKTDTHVSNSTALTVSPVQSVQVFTSAPTAFVANVLTNQASQKSNSATNTTLNLALSSQGIHLGESFTLTIEIKGVDRGVASPDLSALPPSDVLFLGQHSNNRSSITIINGHMTRDVMEGRVFSYKITPQSQGAYHTGPVRVIVAGKTYTHPGVTVEVAGVPDK